MEQDGPVNVKVGDVVLQDTVPIEVAPQVAANICGVEVGPVAVLGRAVDRSGNDQEQDGEIVSVPVFMPHN